jgi:acetyltransferase-like isoleucine patch superfamily enzyme
MEVLYTPWKIWNFVESLLCYPFVRLQFLINGIAWRPGWRFIGLPVIQKHRLSTMRFGARMHLRSSMRSNNVGVNHPVFFSTLQKGAELIIGDNFSMSGGSIIVAERIEICDNVVFGPNLLVMDAEYHPLDPVVRKTTPTLISSAPVIIEDDVYLGSNALILRGVHIGKGSVVAAHSVVTHDVPPGVVVGGNPAKVLREINA